VRSTAEAIGGTVQEAQSGASGHLARFAFAPPRHFVLPAVLLLLSEEPSYGYEMVKGLRAFRFGDVDRPAVYRALAQLEKDGLVQSWSAESKAGQARRVYGLTEDGERALRAWMGIVKEERDALDRVLRRYLSGGTPEALLAEAAVGWSEFDEHAGAGNGNGNGGAPVVTTLQQSPLPADPELRDDAAVEGAEGVRRFSVSPERSAVLIEARSTVGPITFGAIGIAGWIETSVSNGVLVPCEHTRAQVEIAVERLASGNRLYDAELLRRIDARRHPMVTLDLDAVTPIGPPDRFTLDGSITFHGVLRHLQGTVVAAMLNTHTLSVRGEHGFDIRDFGVSSPTVLMFRIYPDVMVKLQLEAELDD
jgi:PadR family transcriptional regulator PadR